MPLKHPIPINSLLYSSCIIFVGLDLPPCWLLFSSLQYSSLFFLLTLWSWCGLIWKSLFILDLLCLVCSFTLPHLSVVLHFMLSSCNLSQSGIPNNVGMLPGTTKKQHQCLMLLFIMATIHTPNCGMSESLYAHIFFTDLFRSMICVFGYSILIILTGILLPSIPVSIIYLHISVLWLVFILAVIIDCTLWNWKFWSYHVIFFCWHVFFFSVFAHVMNFCVVPWQNPLSLVCLCSCISVQKYLLCHILHSSCCRLDISLAHPQYLHFLLAISLLIFVFCGLWFCLTHFLIVLNYVGS